MNFKKYYINYVLRGILQSGFYGARDDEGVRKVLEKIISVPDTAKAAYLSGKTAGLELLFKYLLYISDKIDKAQITIFNLKDNYEYDLQNLRKICEGIRNYKSAVKKEAAAEVPASETGAEIPEDEELPAETMPDESVSEEEENEAAEPVNSTEEEEISEFTLIENSEETSSEDEVFGLEGISRSVELDLPTEEEETVTEEETVAPAEENIAEETVVEENTEDEFETEEINEITEYEDEIISAATRETIRDEKEEIPVEEEQDDFEFEIKKDVPAEETAPENDDSSGDGAVASEVYYKFENKFFEDVKILEKLFSYVKKECKGKELERLNENNLQRFTEIIEISGELADMTRQLQLELTEDIFFTINLLFTRAIKTPAVIFPERIELLSSALALVTSLIKEEDYLEHDEVVNNIEVLKEDLKKPAGAPKVETANDEITEEEYIREALTENKPEPEKGTEQQEEIEDAGEIEIQRETVIEEEPPVEQVSAAGEVRENNAEESAAEEMPEGKPAEDDTTSFKMKYLVKEFEKIFLNLGNIHGEYSKYEILEAVDEMNELLRMLAKISSSVKNADVLKLSEVSYVFLKYLKDYKMDLLDKEIQQIIKYIIFTYKMLLTGRKPEDFEILVQYLNNPVKIFTDT
jgi:hypothetical protein